MIIDVFKNFMIIQKSEILWPFIFFCYLNNFCRNFFNKMWVHIYVFHPKISNQFSRWHIFRILFAFQHWRFDSKTTNLIFKEITLIFLKVHLENNSYFFKKLFLIKKKTSLVNFKYIQYTTNANRFIDGYPEEKKEKWHFVGGYFL